MECTTTAVLWLEVALPTRTAAAAPPLLVPPAVREPPDAEDSKSTSACAGWYTAHGRSPDPLKTSSSPHVPQRHRRVCRFKVGGGAWSRANLPPLTRRPLARSRTGPRDAGPWPAPARAGVGGSSAKLGPIPISVNMYVPHRFLAGGGRPSPPPPPPPQHEKYNEVKKTPKIDSLEGGGGVWAAATR